MANKKITSLTELTSPAVGDFIPIVDVSDTTDSAQGTTKKVLVQKIGITQIINKTSDETVNNSTTLQDDDALILPVLANEIWKFTLTIILNTSATADFKYAFTYPSGTTMNWYDGEVLWGGNTEVDTVSVGLSGGGTLVRTIILDGVIKVSSTAGNITFQWCQNALQVFDTKVLAGSNIIATRLA